MTEGRSHRKLGAGFAALLGLAVLYVGSSGSARADDATERVRLAAKRIRENAARLGKFRVEYEETRESRFVPRRWSTRTLITVDGDRIRHETASYQPIGPPDQTGETVIRTIADGVWTGYLPDRRQALKHRPDPSRGWEVLDPRDFGSLRHGEPLVERLAEDPASKFETIRRDDGSELQRAVLEQPIGDGRHQRRYDVEFDPRHGGLPTRVVHWKLTRIGAEPTSQGIERVCDLQYRLAKNPGTWMMHRATERVFGGYPNRRVQDPDSDAWDGRTTWKLVGEPDFAPEIDETTFEIAFPPGTKVEDFTKTF